MKPLLRPLAAALLVGLLQVGFLLAQIEGRAAILRDGREVRLSVEPVDPRDLLRGDYVRLGYAISTLDVAQLDPTAAAAGRPVAGAPVMVRLAPGEDGLWQAVSFRPASVEVADQPGTVDMRGTVDTFLDAIGTYRLLYGIERFYLPEGEGLAIERDLRVRPFQMVVAVADDGTAQIKAFFDGERRLYEEPLY